jgi:hypothetical protein
MDSDMLMTVLLEPVAGSQTSPACTPPMMTVSILWVDMDALPDARRRYEPALFVLSIRSTRIVLAGLDSDGP